MLTYRLNHRNRNTCIFHRFPMNWQTPTGYMTAFAIQFLWMIGGTAVVFSIILTFSGICEIFGAFTMDINKNSIDLNDFIVSGEQKFTAHDRIEISKRLYATLEFHSMTKQLSPNGKEFLFTNSLKIVCLSFQNGSSLLFHIQSHFCSIFWTFNTMLVHFTSKL